ncbi:MAG: type II toxin-antitoxin system VapC family toxin [Cyanobacteria bacterium P01_H01_bin.121]
MNLLLDTHIVIWYFQDDQKLRSNISKLLEDSSNHLYLSSISLWEIAIKLNIGKLNLEIEFSDFQRLLTQFSIATLPISFADTQEYVALALHHRDPFDRMLIAQAIANSLTIVSTDGVFDAYPVQRLWA